MNSEELAPVADEEPVCENQEKSICVKNFSEVAESEIVSGTHGKASDETSLLGQNTSEDAPIEVEGEPVPLILVSAKEPAVPDDVAADINNYAPIISSDDDVGVLSKDLAYNEGILKKAEESDSGNSGLIASGITLEYVLKADVSEPSNKEKSSESVSDGSSSQKAKGLDFDLNEDVYDQEVDCLKSVSVKESGYRSEQRQDLSGMYLNIKTSGVSKHELDLNYMPTNDDLQSSYGWVSPNYQTQPGYLSYEKQQHAFPTWSSAVDYHNMGIDADLQSSCLNPIYVSDDEEPMFPTWGSPLSSFQLGVDSMSCTINEAKPAKRRFNPNNTSFMRPEDDPVEFKSGEWDLKLFGQPIPVSEGLILKTGMKRKDIDCTLQMCSSDYKR